MYRGVPSSSQACAKEDGLHTHPGPDDDHGVFPFFALTPPNMAPGVVVSERYVNLAFWHRIQVLSFAYVLAFLVFTAFAFAELCGYEALPIPYWTMIMALIWFAQTLTTVWAQRLAWNRRHGSPRQNPLVLVLWLTWIVYTMQLLSLSLFHLFFSDEVEVLEDRSEHVQPSGALIDPRVHSLWNMLMVEQVIMCTLLFMSLVPVWFYAQERVLGERIVKNSGGDEAAMAEAAKRLDDYRNAGSEALVVDYNAGQPTMEAREPTRRDAGRDLRRNQVRSGGARAKGSYF